MSRICADSSIRMLSKPNPMSKNSCLLMAACVHVMAITLACFVSMYFTRSLCLVNTSNGRSDCSSSKIRETDPSSGDNPLLSTNAWNGNSDASFCVEYFSHLGSTCSFQKLALVSQVRSVSAPAGRADSTPMLSPSS